MFVLLRRTSFFDHLLWSIFQSSFIHITNYNLSHVGPLWSAFTYYICIQIRTIQLLIFTEKFSPLPGFEPETSPVWSWYATNWAILAWMGGGLLHCHSKSSCSCSSSLKNNFYLVFISLFLYKVTTTLAVHLTSFCLRFFPYNLSESVRTFCCQNQFLQNEFLLTGTSSINFVFCTCLLLYVFLYILNNVWVLGIEWKCHLSNE